LEAVLWVILQLYLARHLSTHISHFIVQFAGADDPFSFQKLCHDDLSHFIVQFAGADDPSIFAVENSNQDSVLIFVFAQLMRKGWRHLDDLAGLSADQLAQISGLLQMFSGE
jgi:hypothetical protein